MNPLDFQTILDGCIKRIQDGEALARCLADYPEMAEELRPLLALSADLIDLEPLTPSAQGAQRGRDLMFAAFDKPEDSVAVVGIQYSVFGESVDAWRNRLKRWFGPQPRLSLVGRLAVIILGLVVSGGVITSASADSLPGDQLYSIKRLVEETRLTFTFNASRQAALENELNERRLEEIEQLQVSGRTAEVQFSGRIEVINSDSWIIDGVEVRPIPELIVSDEIVVGQTVTVNSEIDEDGTILINEAEIDDEPTERPELIQPSSAPSPTILPTNTATKVPTQTGQPATATPNVLPTDRPTETATPTPTATVIDPTSTVPSLATSAPIERATLEATPTLSAEPSRDSQSGATRQAEATATASATASASGTTAPNSTRIANGQATQSANGTRAAHAQATVSANATLAANGTRIADAQATQSANATKVAQMQATQSARATEQANQQATVSANATLQSNQQATRAMLATAEANAQATRIAKATAAASTATAAQATTSAQATENAIPTSTPIPEPTATPVRDVAPTATRVRDG